MTATVTSPRGQLVDEMGAAYREALATSDPKHRAYWAGVGVGYGIAFGFQTDDTLVHARLDPYSECRPIEHWRAPAFADEDSYRASGVRYGYSLATSERLDATECELCGERICTDDDDYEQCSAGTFCAGCGCHQTWHRSGEERYCPDTEGEWERTA